MSGVHERQSENRRQLHGHVTGVGVVPVDNVGDLPAAADETDGFVDVFVQMGPERLLAHVAFPPALNANDTAFVGQGFDRHAVVRGDAFIGHQPREQVHPPDLRQGAQMAGQFHHIGDLAAGVGVAPELQRTAANQPVQAEQLNIQRSMGHAVFLFALSGLGRKFDDTS